MTTILFLLTAGLVLLYIGGEGLIRGSSSLAVRAGISPLVVGLTVVAFGTSAPELIVSIKAVLADQTEIAVGNVVGSNIFNVAVILGLSAVLRPLQVKLQLLWFDMPIMIAASFITFAMFLDGQLSSMEGGVLFAGIVAYTVTNVILARRVTDPEVTEEYADANPQSASIWRDVLFIAGGLVVLVFGARMFVDGAISLARLLGVSEAVIGLTIVAVGTSLPEIAASIIAVLRKEEDIAIGNVVGSNIFNLLSILGIAGIIGPIHLGDISNIDFYYMIGLAIVLLPMLKTGMRLSRIEGGLLLASYGGYLWWLWPA